jgi:curved DNA-binding protein
VDGPAGFEGFQARGADQETVLELSLEEAAAGGRRQLTLGDGRSYDVNIPAGVRDGQRIRLAGEGGKGAAGGPSGDLFLRVRIKPHRAFASTAGTSTWRSP